ncbi:MAG: crotonase/enoyl-CoA hydratase family protein [Pseudomonadales bacterium]
MHSYRCEDDIAIIQFDDGKANAVGHGFIDHMTESLAKADTEAKAVVIAGREGVFSGGFDLKEFEKGAEATNQLVARGETMLGTLFSYPLPVVAACSGHAVAAGGFMLLAADTRIGAEGPFKLGLNETAIGMILPAFGLILGDARLDVRYRTRALIQAELFDPEQAVAAGFLDQTVPADQLLRQAIETAGRLGAMPGHAYRGNKRAQRRDAIAALAAAAKA